MSALALLAAALLPRIVLQEAGGGTSRPLLPRIDAPSSALAWRVTALSAAAGEGAAAAAEFLAAALPAAVDLPLRWAINHEEFGRETGISLELLDDPARGPVTFTFGSGGRDEQGCAWPLDEATAWRTARRAGALAALRRLAAEVAPARRAALAEHLSDADFASDAHVRCIALVQSGFALPNDFELAEARTSPELVRLLEGSRLAVVLATSSPARSARSSLWRSNDRTAWEAALRAAPPRSAPHLHRDPPRDLKGFCFAHEGYGWIDGYGSRAAQRSLAALRDVGANSVSITPFAFQRDIAAPTIQMLHERKGGRFAPESDGAVAATIADAQALGLTVILKPHLWCGHGHWCGEIAMRDEPAWSAWFAEFERFVLHYALLAQRLHVPVLAVATELPGTTARETQWRALIARVRAVYGGVVTYCANWGTELANLPFWDSFDAVGVSAYWPLADRSGASLDEVAKRFSSLQDELDARRRLLGKPIWFLEVGFPDVSEPWRTPHAHDGTFDEGADQGRAYEMVLAATAHRALPDALFWWKWPSDLDRLPPGQRHDFWPCGRAAESALRRAWGARQESDDGGRR